MFVSNARSPVCRRRSLLVWLGLGVAIIGCDVGLGRVDAEESKLEPLLPSAKPVPAMQVIPLPESRASIRCENRELSCYWFSSALRRPFLFPVVGPSGRSLTRMGHPHDPVTHSHHNSVWISHADVNGVDFWSDQGDGMIQHVRILRFEDSDERARIVSENRWLDHDNRVVLTERRSVQVEIYGNRESRYVLDCQLRAESNPVVFGPTPFGLIGVRMAKTIGIHDGGGTIRNSEGNIDEEGPNGCFRKTARWCDYSGPIANGTVEGIALFDHPLNPNHPRPFHVRADGWMGACLTYNAPLKLMFGEIVRLRYGLYVHRGLPDAEVIDRQWDEFARDRTDDLWQN